MKDLNYMDYIRFMEKQGYLEDVGSSDDDINEEEDED